MKILITLVLALASTLQAETVYFSEHGKTFHTNQKCMSLARTAHVLHADDKDAAEHGLKPCGICNRAKKATKKATNGAWAK